MGESKERLKQSESAQARFNQYGDVSWVASRANERGPKPQQGDLLLWAEDQEKLARWKEANDETAN